jgi:hypothetical protein
MVVPVGRQLVQVDGLPGVDGEAVAGEQLRVAHGGEHGVHPAQRAREPVAPGGQPGDLPDRDVGRGIEVAWHLEGECGAGR